MSVIMHGAITIIVGSLIFAGFPLLGWGIADIQEFFSNPARFGYVLLVILLQIFIVIKFPMVTNIDSQGNKTVQRQKLALILIQALSIAIIVIAPLSDRHDFAIWVDFDTGRYLGLVVFAVGFIIANWSQSALGKQFSIQVTLQADHELVTSGPYRYIRHPRYLSIIVFNVGLCLVFHSWLAIGLVAVLAAVLLWRIQDEEIFMRQEFPIEWETYSKNSWRLIPYLF